MLSWNIFRQEQHRRSAESPLLLLGRHCSPVKSSLFVFLSLSTPKSSSAGPALTLGAAVAVIQTLISSSCGSNSLSLAVCVGWENRVGVCEAMDVAEGEKDGPIEKDNENACRSILCRSAHTCSCRQNSPLACTCESTRSNAHDFPTLAAAARLTDRKPSRLLFVVVTWGEVEGALRVLSLRTPAHLGGARPPP